MLHMCSAPMKVYLTDPLKEILEFPKIPDSFGNSQICWAISKLLQLIFCEIEEIPKIESKTYVVITLNSTK